MSKKVWGKKWNNTTHMFEARWGHKYFKIIRPFTSKEMTLSQEKAKELLDALIDFLPPDQCDVEEKIWNKRTEKDEDIIKRKFGKDPDIKYFLHQRNNIANRIEYERIHDKAMSDVARRVFVEWELFKFGKSEISLQLFKQRIQQYKDLLYIRKRGIK